MATEDNKAEKKTAKITTFEQKLRRSNSKIRAERAGRISNSLVRAQRSFVDQLENKVDALTNKLEAMMDLSADNQTTSMNVVSPNFSADDFVADLNATEKELEMQQLRLKIAKRTTKKWFTANVEM